MLLIWEGFLMNFSFQKRQKKSLVIEIYMEQTRTVAAQHCIKPTAPGCVPAEVKRALERACWQRHFSRNRRDGLCCVKRQLERDIGDN